MDKRGILKKGMAVRRGERGEGGTKKKKEKKSEEEGIG
jgi:hypothetical protein